MNGGGTARHRAAKLKLQHAPEADLRAVYKQHFASSNELLLDPEPPSQRLVSQRQLNAYKEGNLGAQKSSKKLELTSFKEGKQAKQGEHVNREIGVPRRPVAFARGGSAPHKAKRVFSAPKRPQFRVENLAARSHANQPVTSLPPQVVAGAPDPRQNCAPNDKKNSKIERLYEELSLQNEKFLRIQQTLRLANKRAQVEKARLVVDIEQCRGELKTTREHEKVREHDQAQQAKAEQMLHAQVRARDQQLKELTKSCRDLRGNVAKLTLKARVNNKLMDVNNRLQEDVKYLRDERRILRESEKQLRQELEKAVKAYQNHHEETRIVENITSTGNTLGLEDGSDAMTKAEKMSLMETIAQQQETIVKHQAEHALLLSEHRYCNKRDDTLRQAVSRLTCVASDNRRLVIALDQVQTAIKACVCSKPQDLQNDNGSNPKAKPNVRLANELQI